MSDPTDFLLARIDEDEAFARRGQSAPAYDHYGASAWEECYKMADAEGCSEEGVAFIKHMSPARVLAECETKRQIIGAWNLQMSEAMEGWPSAPIGGQGAEVFYDVLCALALPYADHPDYRDEWKL